MSERFLIAILRAQTESRVSEINKISVRSLVDKLCLMWTDKKLFITAYCKASLLHFFVEILVCLILAAQDLPENITLYIWAILYS